MKLQRIAEDALRDELVSTMLQKTIRGELVIDFVRAKSAPTHFAVTKKTKRRDDVPITARPVGEELFHPGTGCYRRKPTCRD